MNKKAVLSQVGLRDDAVNFYRWLLWRTNRKSHTRFRFDDL